MMQSLSVKKKNESVGLLEPKHTHATWVAPSTLAKVGLVSVSACAGWIFLASSSASPSSSSLRIDPASSRASFEVDGAMSLRVSRTHLVNPETSVPEVTFLAIGDWGGTLGKDKGDPGSCCQLYNGGVDTRHTRYKVDYYAQAYVAELMAQSAAELHPSRILGHGDNFYWNGVGTGDANYRLEQTFEKVYNASTLQNVPWLNVAGNHDIGGATFICGEADGAYRECKDEAELLAYLDIRFEAQANYTSPYNNRWNLRGHYYVERIVKNDVSVEVYNVDTNHAENHGSKDVCCQCYGYASQLGLDTGVCNDPQPGDVACVGGNVTLFNACVAKIESWANESLTRAMADMKASTATFKIVNTHYSPHYHMDPVKMDKWYNLCREAGVAAWFNGHTHGFNHDIAKWGTHFFQNGGGGGISTSNIPAMDNGKVKTKWVVEGNPYGFMELSFSKDWLKVQFVSFDDQWTFGGLEWNATTIGGLERGHCWFVPRTFRESVGVECHASVNGAVGAPITDDDLLLPPLDN
ncbi:hypothetical protein H257_05229 [Aphanomyces astaci]|uniref:Calcineurin-like phosphoesterase domain-containing protein n=1 Tax=Aphanomyces astaci TaxID=112090 RepID=W4GUH7_APHAT|nr:hypothetical protein H257_05229 [Aphanomyces astaci]ETV82659.1 hypothetical protein H257_05229 [Aphanomyces astaci]|eukprot:XP_009828328.1 hypothetical protein H257_05229 [Aphanomyces astaci]